MSCVNCGVHVLPFDGEVTEGNNKYRKHVQLPRREYSCKRVLTLDPFSNMDSYIYSLYHALLNLWPCRSVSYSVMKPTAQSRQAVVQDPVHRVNQFTALIEWKRGLEAPDFCWYVVHSTRDGCLQRYTSCTAQRMVVYDDIRCHLSWSGSNDEGSVVSSTRHRQFVGSL